MRRDVQQKSAALFGSARQHSAQLIELRTNLKGKRKVTTTFPQSFRMCFSSHLSEKRDSLGGSLLHRVHIRTKRLADLFDLLLRTFALIENHKDVLRGQLASVRVANLLERRDNNE